MHPEVADSIIPCKVNSDYFTIAKPIIQNATADFLVSGLVV